jgi:hypothetical protein
MYLINNIFNYGVIKKGDACFRICNRQAYLAQEKARRIMEYQKKYNKFVDYRWKVTQRAIIRWRGR